MLETALVVRETLEGLGMRPLAKTSGASGIHIYVLIVRGPLQKEVWQVAKTIALGETHGRGKRLDPGHLEGSQGGFSDQRFPDRQRGAAGKAAGRPVAPAAAQERPLPAGPTRMSLPLKYPFPPMEAATAPGGPSRWSTERSTEWVPLKPKLVVEVQYDHVTSGRFRHGTRFLRWRPDKDPRQCTMDQLVRQMTEPPGSGDRRWLV